MKDRVPAPGPQMKGPPPAGGAEEGGARRGATAYQSVAFLAFTPCLARV